MASIVVHMLRIFFTGAFRRPRETNWLIGVTLFILGIAEGFAGYSMPDDLLSGTGLRIMASIILTIPIVGNWSTSPSSAGTTRVRRSSGGSTSPTCCSSPRSSSG
jgi:quinol-cytochrome oxidoreductase complex cytochrome b subunit